MTLYRQSIILFGAVLPIVITVALLGICFGIKSTMEKSFNQKQANYRTFEQDRMASSQIESKVIRQQVHLERWLKQLSGETASTVAVKLREVTEKLPGKEIQQTAFERLGSGGALAPASGPRSSKIRIAFRGTFRTLQHAFLGLETQMPRLQLQELRLDPVTSQSSLLNCQAIYTAWEK